VANRSNESSRQKRARENRARRAALEARTKAAQTPREERVKQAAASGAGKGGSVAQADANGSKARKGGTTREALAQGRLGQVPVDIDTLQGGFLRKVVQVPGGMQVLMAAVLVLVLSLMSSFTATVPPEGAEAGADPTRTLFDAYGASALLFLAPPLILVGNAVYFSLHERRRRMWVISAVMMVIFSALMLQYIFPAGFLAYAAYRSKRIEEGPARRAASDDDDDDAADDPIEEAGQPGPDEVSEHD